MTRWWDRQDDTDDFYLFRGWEMNFIIKTVTSRSLSEECIDGNTFSLKTGYLDNLLILSNRFSFKNYLKSQKDLILGIFYIIMKFLFKIMR